jgi:hypothetical protein
MLMNNDTRDYIRSLPNSREAVRGFVEGVRHELEPKARAAGLTPTDLDDCFVAAGQPEHDHADETKGRG